MLGARSTGELAGCRRAAALLESAARCSRRSTVKDRLAALYACSSCECSGRSFRYGRRCRSLVHGPGAGLRHHHAARRRCRRRGWLWLCFRRGCLRGNRSSLRSGRCRGCNRFCSRSDRCNGDRRFNWRLRVRCWGDRSRRRWSRRNWRGHNWNLGHWLFSYARFFFRGRNRRLDRYGARRRRDYDYRPRAWCRTGGSLCNHRPTGRT
jgi:hypothetical protein